MNEEIIPDLKTKETNIGTRIAFTCLFLVCFVLGVAAGVIYMESRFFEITDHSSAWVIKNREVCESKLSNPKDFCKTIIEFKPVTN